MIKKDNKEMSIHKVTSMKISYATKKRLDKIRRYPRESYEEIIRRILYLLNICRQNPEQARRILISLERQIERNKLQET